MKTWAKRSTTGVLSAALMVLACGLGDYRALASGGAAENHPAKREPVRPIAPLPGSAALLPPRDASLNLEAASDLQLRPSVLDAGAGAPVLPAADPGVAEPGVTASVNGKEVDHKGLGHTVLGSVEGVHGPVKGDKVNGYELAALKDLVLEQSGAPKSGARAARDFGEAVDGRRNGEASPAAADPRNGSAGGSLEDVSPALEVWARQNKVRRLRRGNLDLEEPEQPDGSAGKHNGDERVEFERRIRGARSGARYARSTEERKQEAEQTWAQEKVRQARAALDQKLAQVSRETGMRLAARDAVDAHMDTVVHVRGYVDFFQTHRKDYDVQLPLPWERDSYDADLMKMAQVYNGRTGKFYVILDENDDNRIVGTAAFTRLGGRVYELRKNYLIPELEGHGIAKRLDLLLMAEARLAGANRMELETAEKMERAIGLYQHLGFKRFERRVNGKKAEAHKGVNSPVFMEINKKGLNKTLVESVR